MTIALFRQLVESERAAVEVEDVLVRRQTRGKSRGDAVAPQLAVRLHFQQTGLAQDAQVFGGIVLRQPEAIRDFIDAEGTFQQQPHDADPRGFAKRLQNRNAVDFSHRNAS